MNWHIGRNPILIAVVIGALCACSAPTTIESTWSDPTFSKKPFEKLAVLALCKTTSDRSAFEKIVANSLQESGISVVQSNTFLDATKMYSHEEMEEKLSDVGAEGILIFKLIAVDEEHRYNPPSYYALSPHFVGVDPYYGYYYPHRYYHGYWATGMQVTSDPGYWQELKYYVIETALYDNETDKLVWTAKSETLNPDNIHELSQSIIKKVKARLLEENYISSPGSSK